MIYRDAQGTVILKPYFSVDFQQEAPLTPRRFDPHRILVDVWSETPPAEISGDFSSHLYRFKPSKSPGVDVDYATVDPFFTEKLPTVLKPTVLSPVSGRIARIERSKNLFGTVVIIDRLGYEHKILHMRLSDRPPLSRAYFPIGAEVVFGEPIGYLGNTRTGKDHVHYSISYWDKLIGRRYFLDIEKWLFDQDGVPYTPMGEDTELQGINGGVRSLRDE